MRIVWNDLEIAANVILCSAQQDGTNSTALHLHILDSVELLQSDTFTYTVENSLGENRQISITCDELSYHIHLTIPGSRDKGLPTTLWIRVCPQIGALGYRMGEVGLTASPCHLRLTGRLSGAATLDWDRTTLWAVPTPQGEYSRCTLTDASEAHLACFGKYNTLYAPLVMEAYPSAVGTGGGKRRVLSLLAAQGWRSPGLRITPLRGSARPRDVLPFEASIEFSDAGLSPGSPPPFPALAARGVITSPFLIFRAAQSFAELRNSAEALNRAFNSVCTVPPPKVLSAAPGNSHNKSAGQLATVSSVLPFPSPARGLAGGKVLRVMRYRDAAEVARCALEANRTGFRYLLFDAGW